MLSRNVVDATARVQGPGSLSRSAYSTVVLSGGRARVANPKSYAPDYGIQYCLYLEINLRSADILQPHHHNNIAKTNNVACSNQLKVV